MRFKLNLFASDSVQNRYHSIHGMDSEVHRYRKTRSGNREMDILFVKREKKEYQIQWPYLFGGGVFVKLGAGYTDTAAGSRRSAQGVVSTSGNRSLKATGTNIDGSLIRRVPIAGSRGVLRQRQLGLGLVNLLGLVGVLVDDRL